MQSLFQIENDASTGVFSVPLWNYVRNGLQDNLSKITNHYSQFPIPAKSSNLLTQIIQTVAVSRTLPYDRFVANCTFRSMNVAQSLKLTSAVSKGKIWENQFYGGCEEIVVAHSSTFNIYEFRDNWKEASPVEILEHSQSNLNMWQPDGSISSNDKGLAVIAINIPMLMAQYYMFCLEQDKLEANGQDRKTIAQFIGAYPLVNALKSHIDHARLNALINYQNGLPALASLKKHSFHLIDYTQSLDTVMKQETDNLKKANKRIAGVLRMVPMIHSQNLQELSELPGMAKTVQCYWALVASRLKILSFAYGVSDQVQRQSATEMEKIRWQFKIQQTSNVLRNNLGIASFYQLAPYMDKLKLI